MIMKIIVILFKCYSSTFAKSCLGPQLQRCCSPNYTYCHVILQMPVGSCPVLRAHQLITTLRQHARRVTQAVVRVKSGD